jgi:dihydrolipoamide dehydrogenase
MDATDGQQQPAAREAPKAAPPTPPRPSAAAAAPPVRAAGGDVDCDVVVIGAGPGGYSAAFRAADLGLRTVLVERYPTLGGVCLNVGCIPSKALLHTAAIVDGARALADHGVTFGEPKVDLAKLRAFKSKVVGKLTGGLAAMAKMRKVTVIQGVAQFAGPHELAIDTKDGKKPLRFANAIIAVGSQAAKLPFLPEDARIVDSTGALELPSLPKKMLIIGGGIIGLEMGTVYSTLGTRLDVVEMMDGLMLGADRDLVAVWQKYNAKRFDRIMLQTKTTKVEASSKGLRATFEGKDPETYDMILVSVGRVPNGKKIGADKAGVAVTERGFIDTDGQMRTNVPHILPSAMSRRTRCSRTRRCTKRMSRPRPRPGRSRTSMRASSRRLPTRIRKWPGSASRRTKRRRREPRSALPSFHGRPPAAPSPTRATRASPSSSSTPTTTASSAAASSASAPAT